MNKKEAVASLKSGSPHERLRAARHLAKNSDTADVAFLREARSQETDAYVKSTLDATISRLSKTGGASEPPLEEQIPREIIRKARTQAVEAVTALLLHEVASPFGLVANAASREIPDYANSNTKRHVDRVQRIFEGIEQLKNATTTPNPQQFDLPEFIDGIIAEESQATTITPAYHGPRPFSVTTDPLLLRFAVCNGLRNAIEAADQSKAEQPVVITWGMSDTDYWITIIDDGPGLAGPQDSAFEPGKSSKKGQGHIGFGLTIAKQAMETLNGFVMLNPGKTGGSRYELKWSR
jgi:C4-dicarboxylate-specific signal transduction histidine kinase